MCTLYTMQDVWQCLQLTTCEHQPLILLIYICGLLTGALTTKGLATCVSTWLVKLQI